MNRRSIPNIGHPQGLKPKSMFVPEIGEQCVNLDGVIELMKSIDTPEAKAFYRAFRKRHAQMMLDDKGQTDPEKLRGEAVLQSLKDMGFTVNLKPVSANENGA